VPKDLQQALRQWPDADRLSARPSGSCS
jgi:hypothetical protein